MIIKEVDVKAMISHIVRGDGADKCRICMGDTSEGQVYLGDTVMMDGDKPVTLAELLETITGVEVLDDGELPNSLCLVCFNSAVNAAYFSILCQKSEKKWTTTIKLLGDLPVAHDLQPCTTSLYLTIDNDRLIIESISEIENPNFKTPKFELKQRKRRSSYSECVCKCPACGKSFKYAHLLSIHLQESGDYKRACHICAEVMSRDDLVQHLAFIHDIRSYPCKTCSALYNVKADYLKHVQTAHKSGAFTCGDCGRTFGSSYGFHAHQSLHLPKTCPSCDRVFRNQQCYIYHMRICCGFSNKKVSYQNKNKATFMVQNKASSRKIRVGLRGSTNNKCICDNCGRTFIGKRLLRAHIQNVHMKSTHRPCPYCGKFLASAHMTEHIKTHESVKLYTCDHCNLVLKSRVGFVQHLRLHTGEKPYACKECGETFSASSRRSEHIRRVHRPDLPPKHCCNHCPAKFHLPYRLKRHMNTVHNLECGKLLFECKDCNVKFSSCRGLVHHSRKHQRNVSSRPSKPGRQRLKTGIGVKE